MLESIATKYKYSLKEYIKYPDQALTKLEGLSLLSDYHFLLQLKSIKAYNSSTGQPLPFNAFSKAEVKVVASVLSLKRSTFYSHLNKVINRGWILKDKNHYRLVSITKINTALKFKTYTSKKKLSYYSYRRLQNIQGIDLHAHRILEIVKLSKKQFEYSISDPQTNSITSTVNNHLIVLNTKGKRTTSKVKRLENFFGMSIDTITNKGGYESKKYVWSKLNEMQKQGLTVKKSSTGKFVKGIEQFNCNLYDCSFDNIFKVSSANPVLVKKIKATAKKKPVLNATEIKFQNFINITANRWILIEEGIVSRNYLKHTKQGRLVSIPRSVWPGILIRGLNNEFFKSVFTNLLGIKNIKVDNITRSTVYRNEMIAELRFAKIDFKRVSLVEGAGNYKDTMVLVDYKNAMVDSKGYNPEYKNAINLVSCID